MRDVDHQHIRPGPPERLGTLEVVAYHPYRRTDQQTSLGIMSGAADTDWFAADPCW